MMKISKLKSMFAATLFAALVTSANANAGVDVGEAISQAMTFIQTGGYAGEEGGYQAIGWGFSVEYVGAGVGGEGGGQQLEIPEDGVFYPGIEGEMNYNNLDDINNQEESEELQLPDGMWGDADENGGGLRLRARN